MSVELQGKGASDGLFMGPARCIGRAIGKRAASGNPAIENDSLSAAIAAAIGDLSRLMEAAGGEAAELLAFQIAMLEDDALSSSAFEAMTGSMSADTAWSAALDAEISGYENADDEYFRARAADLKDIRDRVLRHLSGEAETAAAGGVVVTGEDMAPTLFLETDWTKGGAIALTGGSATSHVAMLARARGVPMVVGLGDTRITQAGILLVDGSTGKVTANPDEAARAHYNRLYTDHTARQAADGRFLHEPTRRKDGSRVELLVNLASTEELDRIDIRTCDGIGLMRSEFLFRDGAALPDEEQQYDAYRRFIAWASGKPVTIRTLDIGGDKPVRGVTPEGEQNPFLGLRGVRLTLARPDLFRTQLRALARAAAHGPLKVMIPMVTVAEELSRTAAILDDCVAELHRAGVAAARPPLGIMMEVPAAALAPDLFREAAFFSIGSNDLTQYLTAASRDEPRVAALNDSGHPAVTRLITSLARFGREQAIPVSLCGDMASEPLHLRALLDAGLTSLSVAPARIARIKAVLAEI